MDSHRIFGMSFAKVYPLYVAKAEKKVRTSAEVDEIIRWLTGYTQDACGFIWSGKQTLRPFSRKPPK